MTARKPKAKPKPTPRKTREAILSDRVLDAVKQYEKGREAFGRAIAMLTACREAVAQAANPARPPAPPAMRESVVMARLASLTSDLRTLCIRLDRLESK